MDADFRIERITQAIDRIRVARATGNEVPTDSFLRDHSDLLPELETEMRKLEVLENALRDASQENDTKAGPLHLRDDFELCVNIPDYELIRPIGLGAFGVVWLGRNKHDGQSYAVKILHNREATELNGVREFKPRAIGNEFVVPIEHVGESEDTYYYTMPLADNANEAQSVCWADEYEPLNLDLYVERRGKLPADHSAKIAFDLLQGLGLLHTGGAIHRDVKPSNVLRFGGQWKLGDPGLLCDEEKVDLQAGTRGYRPLGEKSSRSSDLYAVGKTLLDITADPSESKRSTADEEIRLSDVIEKACHDDIDRRFSSAREFQTALKPFFSESRSKGPYWMIIAAAAMAAVLAVPAIGLFSNQDTDVQIDSCETRLLKRDNNSNIARPIGTIGLSSHEGEVDDSLNFQVKLNESGYAYLVAFRDQGVSVEYPKNDYVKDQSSTEFAIHQEEVISLSETPGFNVFVLVSSDKRIADFDDWAQANTKGIWKHQIVDDPRAWTYDGFYKSFMVKKRGAPGPDIRIETAPKVMRRLVEVFESHKHVDDVWAIGFSVVSADSAISSSSGSIE